MKSCVSEIHACNFFFVCSNPGGVRSPGDDQAKRPREVGLGGLDLSFRREGEEDEARSEGELVGSGKEEDVERRTEEEEGVRRVGGEEEGRETESDDGTPRPNGGRNQRKFKIKMSKKFGKFKFELLRTQQEKAACSSVGKPGGLDCGQG